jgi:hypothetical protein
MGKSRARGHGAPKGYVKPSLYMKTIAERSKPLMTDKPGVFFAPVYHDDDCAIFKGARCTCSPVVGEVTRMRDNGV